MHVRSKKIGATTFSITTLSITTFSIKGLFGTLSIMAFSINDTQLYSTSAIMMSVMLIVE